MKYRIPVIDFGALLWNLYQAKNNEAVGFEHCFLSMEQFLARMNKESVWVETEELEVLLCAANQLDELNKFFHPTLSFNQLVQRLEVKFNRKYNTIKEGSSQ